LDILIFEGWLDGISSTAVVIIGIIFGLFFIRVSKKRELKRLTYLGLFSIFAALLYLGVFLDFLSVIFTSENFPDVYNLVALLSYIFFAPAMLTIMYISMDIQLPKYKWPILGLYLILGIVFNILIFLDPYSSFYYDPPQNSGETLIDYNIQLLSHAGIFLAIMLLPVVITLGLILIIKSIQASGVIRKKFFLLACGAFSYGIFGMLEGFTAPGILVVIVRAGYIISFWLMYLGLKEAI